MNFFKTSSEEWINLDKVELVCGQLRRLCFIDGNVIDLNEEDFKRLEEILESNFDKKGVKIK